jgi:hypothetical protein
MVTSGSTAPRCRTLDDIYEAGLARAAALPPVTAAQARRAAQLLIPALTAAAETEDADTPGSTCIHDDGN